MGVAGTGKTTLGREIAKKIWAVYLDNNYIADAFFPDARNGRRYERLRPHFYNALYAIAEGNLAVGNSVLLDVPHVKEVQSPEWPRQIKQLAAVNGATLIAIRCFCSADLLRRRIIERGEERDGWKLRHWDEFLAAQPLQVSIPFPHLDINTEESLPRTVRAAVRYIRTRALHGQKKPVRSIARLRKLK